MAQINFGSIKGLKKNESLAKHTTLGIGGPADWFCEIKTIPQLIKVVKFCRRQNIPLLILGDGSNLLVSDKGIRGMVMKVQSAKRKAQSEKIIAEAGTPLKKLVQLALENSLSGLEFAVGIPGTIGGAVVGNAGTADKWIGDMIEEVEVLDQNGEIKKLSGADCQFGYRGSRFQKTKEIVLRVVLKLKKDSQEKIKQRMAEIIAKRTNQPKEKSAGSIFKNPKEKPAGWLIEKCGLKGKRISDAQISPKHANFIVNLGQANCEDVLKLISLVKGKVKRKFGIILDEEIKIVGEF